MAIRDARQVPADSGIETDLCIIGGGPAGVSIALEFANCPVRVCLLESGNEWPERRFRALNRGYAGELPGKPLHRSRSRRLGGTSDVWSGWCRPFEPWDFDHRHDYCACEWPIAAADLRQFYQRAHDLLRFPSDDYSVSGAVQNSASLLSVRSDIVSHRIYRISPVISFREVFGGRLRDSENIDVYLQATVTNIQCSASCSGVEKVTVSKTDGGHFSVRAKHYVLAAGGIENARLLLSSDAQLSQGAGSSSGLVGQSFMEHPYFYAGAFLPENGIDAMRAYLGSATRRPNGSANGFATLAPRRDADCGTSAPNWTAYFLAAPEYKCHREFQSPAVSAAIRLGQSLARAELPDNLAADAIKVVRGLDDLVISALRRLSAARAEAKQGVLVRCVFEAVVGANNRVVLTDHRDRLGMRRVQLNWSLSERDRNTIFAIQSALSEALNQPGIGRFEPFPMDPRTGWPGTLSVGNHHMGTTRMASSPEHGVVDPNCTVHGIVNLSIAGSSVFASAGVSNPTLTILALAIRLADHIKSQLSR